MGLKDGEICTHPRELEAEGRKKIPEMQVPNKGEKRIAVPGEIGGRGNHSPNNTPRNGVSELG